MIPLYMHKPLARRTRVIFTSTSHLKPYATAEDDWSCGAGAYVPIQNSSKTPNRFPKSAVEALQRRRKCTGKEPRIRRKNSVKAQDRLSKDAAKTRGRRGKG